MILKNKFLILLVVIIMTLTSCDGFRKAVTGGSKKPKGDEFLVIKKEPLTLPPDFENLPSPNADEETQDEEENNVKEILSDISNNQNTTSSSNASESLENSILKKINKN